MTIFMIAKKYDRVKKLEDKLLNVIFLDIDGVLNSPNYTKKFKEMKTRKGRIYKNIDDNALNYLKELQNRYDAKIVLTSTWRKWRNPISIDKFKKSIKENPITEDERTEDYANLRTLYEKLRLEYNLDLDDMTDDLQNRMLEIQLYLLLHKEIEKFVILDDDDEHFSEIFKEQFVQCCAKGDSFGKKEFEQACNSFDQQERYIPNIEGLKELQDYFDKLTQVYKVKAESLYRSILKEDFEGFSFDVSGTQYKRLYHYLPDEIKAQVDIDSWKNGRIITNNQRTFEKAIINNEDYFSSLMLLEAGSDSLPLYSIVLEQMEIDEKEEMQMMQDLISKLSEEQKMKLLQSARQKYEELQENNLHGSIKNMREVIQYLFHVDISKIQIEKENDLDKELD